MNKTKPCCVVCDTYLFDADIIAGRDRHDPVGCVANLLQLREADRMDQLGSESFISGLMSEIANLRAELEREKAASRNFRDEILRLRKAVDLKSDALRNARAGMDVLQTQIETLQALSGQEPPQVTSWTGTTLPENKDAGKEQG